MKTTLTVIEYIIRKIVVVVLTGYNIVIVPPMLMIPNQLEGARIGDYSKLECHSEANPPSINYWTNERGDMIVSGMYITIFR